MFEYDKDIALLHGTYISAFKQDLANVQILEILRQTLSIIERQGAHNSGLILHSRFHSLLIYSSLLNEHIIVDTPENEDYFESVKHLFPNVTLDLYFELLAGLKWKTHFCECMQAFPQDVSLAVIEALTSQVFQTSLVPPKSYLLHCAITVILISYTAKLDSQLDLKLQRYFSTLRVIETDSKLRHVETENDKMSQITMPSLQKKDCNAEISSRLCHLLTSILGYLQDSFFSLDTNVLDETNTTRFHILAMMLSSLNYILESITSEIGKNVLNFINFEELIKWYDLSLPILDVDLLSETSELLERRKNGDLLQKITSQIEPHEGFLTTFINIVSSKEAAELQSYMCGLRPKASGEDLTVITKAVDDSQAIQVALRNIIKFITSVGMNNPNASAVISQLSDIMSSLRSLFSVVCEEIGPCYSDDEQLVLVIKHKVLGYKEALVYMIIHKQLENDRWMNVLVENLDHLSHGAFLKLLLNRLVIDFPNNKALSKIFLESFQKASLPTQGNVLKLFLQEDSDCLKQDTFNRSLTVFLNQANNQRNALELSDLFQLCIQSPTEVVARIVEQSCENAGQVPILAEMLVIVKDACCWKRKGSEPCIFLLSLKTATDKINAKKVQNLRTLVKLLLEKLEDTYASLLVGELFHYCIAPYLHPEIPDLYQNLAINLLQVSCQEPKVKLKCLHLCHSSVIFCLCQLLDFAEKQRDGYRKELTLLGLMEYKKALNCSLPEKEKLWLQHKLNILNSMLKLYIRELIGEEPYDYPYPFHLICKFASILGCTEDLKEVCKSQGGCFPNSYTATVIAVASVLPGGTFEEWCNLFAFIDFLFEEQLLIVPNNILEVIPSNGMNTLLVFKLFTDSLLVLSDVGPDVANWSYMLSVFSRVLKVVCIEKKQDLWICVLYFCEVCRLSLKVLPVYSAQMTVPLYELLNICSSYASSISTEEQSRISYILEGATELLPESNAKVNVLSKLKEGFGAISC